MAIMLVYKLLKAFSWVVFCINFTNVCLCFKCKVREKLLSISNLFHFNFSAIGLGPSQYPLDCQPGWNVDSIGFHADDGRQVFIIICLFTSWGNIKKIIIMTALGKSMNTEKSRNVLIWLILIINYFTTNVKLGISIKKSFRTLEILRNIQYFQMYFLFIEFLLKNTHYKVNIVEVVTVIGILLEWDVCVSYTRLPITNIR